MENKRTPAQVRRFCLITAGVILPMFLFSVIGMLFPMAFSSTLSFVVIVLCYPLLVAIMARCEKVGEGYVPPRKSFPAYRIAVLVLFLLILLLKQHSVGAARSELIQFRCFWAVACLSAVVLADVLLVLRKLSTSQEQ